MPSRVRPALLATSVNCWIMSLCAATMSTRWRAVPSSDDHGVEPVEIEDAVLRRDRDALVGPELHGRPQLLVVGDHGEELRAHDDLLVGDAEGEALAGEAALFPERLELGSRGGRRCRTSPSNMRPSWMARTCRVRERETLRLDSGHGVLFEVDAYSHTADGHACPSAAWTPSRLSAASWIPLGPWFDDPGLRPCPRPGPSLFVRGVDVQSRRSRSAVRRSSSEPPGWPAPTSPGSGRRRQSTGVPTCQGRVDGERAPPRGDPRRRWDPPRRGCRSRSGRRAGTPALHLTPATASPSMTRTSGQAAAARSPTTVTGDPRVGDDGDECRGAGLRRRRRSPERSTDPPGPGVEDDVRRLEEKRLLGGRRRPGERLDGRRPRVHVRIRD